MLLEYGMPYQINKVRGKAACCRVRRCDLLTNNFRCVRFARQPHAKAIVSSMLFGRDERRLERRLHLPDRVHTAQEGRLPHCAYVTPSGSLRTLAHASAKVAAS